MKHIKLALCTMAAPLVLAACGGGGEEATEAAGAAMLDNGMTVAAAIEARQEALKEMGGAMKTISDQLKLESPDVDAIYASAQTLEAHAANIGDWFPAGTGPDTGVETEALAVIWEQPDDFAAAVARYQTAAAAFEDVAVTRDVAAIQGAMGQLGGSCKNCHDNFRLDDN